jgi:murein DD-endopeptidase MepM/ murein hydrolase activator NlpD
MRRYRALAAIALVAFLGQAAAGTYRVKRGDTLSRLARQHGTTVDAIAAANGLTDPDFIREGQLLAVSSAGSGGAAGLVTPAPSASGLSTKRVVIGTGERRHVVARGENLARIAARYGATVADLARANNIRKPNLIRSGTVIVVPGAPADWLCPVAGQTWFSGSWGEPRPGGRRHLGTDVFAHRGTPVVAPVSGTVTHRSGRVAGKAFYLKGDDGNLYYGAHLDTLEGGPRRVGRGQRLGTVGSTGNAEGKTPHLHFEIHLAGTEPVDPLPTVERWCR